MKKLGKETIVNRPLLSAAICAVLLAGLAGPVLADDFAPPPWNRGAPLTTVYEWEFRTNANPLGPDGDIPTIIGDSGTPLFADIYNMSWNNGDGDGEWLADNPLGNQFLKDGQIQFDLPNWIDFEPVKYLRVQITYTDGGGNGSPWVSDTAVGAGQGPYTTVRDGITDNTVLGRGQRLEEWSIFPNPDFETVWIQVPFGTCVDQVVFDTISIPEPMTICLLGIGGLTLLRRRRRG